MSSAILYLAIVAIWACVLIPRWLKRDSVRSAAAATERPAAQPDAMIHESGVASDIAHPSSLDQPDADDATEPRSLPEPLSREESRRRMVTARRRLLIMLIALEVAAIALAVLGLAAVWVIVPPSLMLVGYLLLLREAAAVDKERAEAEADARRRASESARGRARAAERRPASAPAPATDDLAAAFAAAPVTADYEDADYESTDHESADYENTVPGRDFAPGLAGKYTTSQAEADGADEDYYEAPRLRAVGD